MSSGIFYVIVYAAGSALCFYLWNKSKDREYLWLSLLGLISAAFNLVRVTTSFVWQPYASIASIGFSITVIALVVTVLAKRR